MKNLAHHYWLVILLLFIINFYNASAQTVIKSQSFDSTASGYADNLNYRVSNTTYVQSTGTSFESSPNSLRFSNNNGTNNRNSRVEFDNVDISSYTGVSVTISFSALLVDNSENLYLRISYDGGLNYSSSTKLIDGDNTNETITWGNPDSDSGSVNSNSYTLNIPDGNTQLRVRVRAIKLDDNEFFYIDNLLIEGTPTPVPEINVLGNTIITIVDGSTTPSINDKTDFGSIDYNSGVIVKTYIIQNTGNATLTIGSVSITGTDAVNFSVTTAPSVSVASGGSTTLSITFNPSSTGLKTASISIDNNDSDENPYNFAIQGTGIQSFFDSDGDSILDNIDIDDDNDGILDTEEEINCEASNGNVVNYKFLNETFGSGTGRASINATNPSATTTYCYEDGTGIAPCTSFSGNNQVNDGEYAVVQYPNPDASNYPSWTTQRDHTGDTNGRMAVFNASYNPSVFYETTITGVLASHPITYSFWTLNVIKSSFPSTILPDITVEFLDLSNNVLASFNTGTFGRCLASPTDNSCTQNEWHQFSTSVNLGNVNAFTVRFINNAPGGNGNDLALDDIVISQTLCDTDNDGVADIFDLDADNDGIPDVVEAGLGIHSDGNATLTNSASWVDSNGNGMHDLSEGHIVLDSDGDGTPNYLDLDSDNDTIFDVDESGSGNSGDPNYQNGDGDITGDGVGDGADTDAVRETDVNSDNILEYFSDGILDIYDYFNGATLNTAYGNTNQGSTGAGWEYYVLDSDNDGVPDYIDIMSDGSSFDISHTLYNSLDGNGDGIIDDTNDLDGDGIVDLFDTDDTIFGSPRDLNRKLHLYFDGRNDYAAESTVINNWSEATIMSWIKIDPAATGSQIIIGQDVFRLQLNSNKSISAYSNGNSINTGAALPLNQWVHIAATYKCDCLSGDFKLYINGSEVANASTSGNLNFDTSSFTIGKKSDSNSDYFHGYIDEVRVFNKALSENELKKVVYQEIEDNAGVVRGAIIPKDIDDYNTATDTSTPLNWASLERYYRMDAYKDDIIDDLSTIGIDVGTGCKIYNSKLIDVQTAPLPFVTTVSCSGDWVNTSNWEHGGIWDIASTQNDAAIVNIKGRIQTNISHKMMGLILDSGSKLEINDDKELNISWYLKLDGDIDLQGESQLVQEAESTLNVNSSGTVERDQQGTRDFYTYNYWSSPVGVSNTTSNNNNYTLPDVLNDGSVATSPMPITFLTSAYNGTSGSPGVTAVGIADYWIWKYANRASDTYAQWQHVRSTGSMLAGEGFTMKGVHNSSSSFTEQQNYAFNGKPNNGDISLTLSAGNDYLIGNPYPSAIDANEFILDNINEGAGRATSNIFDGTLYFWDHFAGNTHILKEYQGGYATRNLLDGIKAVSTDARINASGDIGTKIPKQYIPVSQGFFVTADAGGSITFKNSQRIFKTEASDPSLFLKGDNKKNKYSAAKSNNNIEDTRQKIWLMFDSPKDYHRQLLAGVDENASSNIDKGYDAPLIEDNAEDMFWIFTEKNFVIQTVDNFDEDQILPIGIKTSIEGLSTIKIDNLENITNDVNVYLHDKELNIYQNLKENNYEVFLSVGEYLNRFEITFVNSQTLNTDEVVTNAGVKVYFSNEKENVVIHNPSLKLIKSVEMFNILGQSLFKFNTNTTENYIEYNAKQIKAGAYILKINTEYGKVSKKVLIK